MNDLVNSFQYGIVPTIIVLIYLIVTRWFDSKKEREQAKKTVKVNAEILDAFNNLNTYLKQITQNILNKEDDKCLAAIRSSFKALAFSITKFGVFTIISNNVKSNKENIISNINDNVYSEFSDMYSELLLYSNEKINFTRYIKEEWKEELVNDVKNIIFSDTESKEDKIYNLYNKINLRVSNYISIVKNKYTNDFIK